MFPRSAAPQKTSDTGSGQIRISASWKIWVGSASIHGYEGSPTQSLTPCERATMACWLTSRIFHMMRRRPTLVTVSSVSVARSTTILCMAICLPPREQSDNSTWASHCCTSLRTQYHTPSLQDRTKISLEMPSSLKQALSLRRGCSALVPAILPMRQSWYDGFLGQVASCSPERVTLTVAVLQTCAVGLASSKMVCRYPGSLSGS
jgi:hypothetical protein